MLTGPACDGSVAVPAAGVLLELPHAPTPTARSAAVVSVRSLRVRIVVLSMRADPFVTKTGRAGWICRWAGGRARLPAGAELHAERGRNRGQDVWRRRARSAGRAAEAVVRVVQVQI